MRYRLRTLMVVIALLAPVFARLAARSSPDDEYMPCHMHRVPILDPIPGEFDPPTSDAHPEKPMCQPLGDLLGEDFS